MTASFWADLIVGGIVVVLVGLALLYIIRSKKKGIKCIGCPEGSRCASCHCSGEAGCGGSAGGCGCHGEEKTQP
ncbi:MAG: FeoB-associated Cys-rich membrane protein [Lachnospiraceae bacterium]|nr:FeoB-associated Cys-rich membrane protein [Lachnospiraceae bacterium]